MSNVMFPINTFPGLLDNPFLYEITSMGGGCDSNTQCMGLYGICLT